MIDYYLKKSPVPSLKGKHYALTKTGSTVNQEDLIDFIVSQKGTTLTKADLLAAFNVIKESILFFLLNGQSVTTDFVKYDSSIKGVFDSFDDLYGKGGPALGIAEQASYEENQKNGLSSGQIIVLATDGVWEARNKKDTMFGKKPLYDIIRQNTNAAAKDILGKCFQSLEEFQSGALREDDITMVVIKIVG